MRESSAFYVEESTTLVDSGGAFEAAALLFDAPDDGDCLARLLSDP